MTYELAIVRPKLPPPADEPPAVAGVDFVQVDWDACPLLPKEPTVVGAFSTYYHEHVIPYARKPKRALYVMKHALRIFGPGAPLSEIDRAASRRYAEIRAAEGAVGATIRRELTLHQAAFNHQHREGRVPAKFRLPMPKPGAPRIRWLTREEHRRLMAAQKSPRLHRFFVIAFATGARAEAIEELTWDRVSFRERTIDFRLPGVDYKNKRRVVAPISDSLLPRLEYMHERRKDDYVIGLGPRGRACTTYHEAKAVLRSIGIDEPGVARHVARHTVASWLLQAGVPILEVARLLGDTVAVVDKVYGHIAQEHLRAAINKL